MRKLSYKTLLIIFFFLLIAVIVLLKFVLPKNKVEASWWNDNWSYRKAISISNTSGSDLTDFQISLSVGTSALIAEGKMQSDCDDIRITDINGNLLPYWIEPTGSNSCNQIADTRVWVKASSLPPSGATIYLYYGNSSTTSISSGTDTFIYFKNNFQASDLGWNWSNGGVENGWAKTWANGYDSPGSTMAWIKNIINITGQEVIAEFTVKLIKLTSTSHNTTNVIFNPTTTTGLYTNTGSSNIANSSGNSLITFGDYATWYGKVGFDSGYGQGNNITNDTNYSKYAFNTDGWVRHVHKLTNSSLMLSGYSLGGLDIGGSAWTYTEKTITSGYTKPNNIALAIGEHTYDSIYLREVFVRKYASVEPTITFQSEEVGGGPIAYWKFDEGIGTTIFDSSNNSNNGTITGATWASENQCINNKCLNFNGSGSPNITIPTNNSLNFGTNNFTISAWALNRDYTYPKSNLMIKKSATCFSDGASNSGFDIGHGYHANGIDICLRDTSNNYIRTTLVFNNGFQPSQLINKWTHYIFIFDRSNNKIIAYINGIKQNNELNISSITGSINSSSSLIIGTLYGWQNDGLIDEVKIYPYARTADQIKQDYNSRGSLSGSSANLGIQSSTAPSLSSKLVAYYKFDEGSGTIANNSSNLGTSYKATLTGQIIPTWKTNGKINKALYFSGIGSTNRGYITTTPINVGNTGILTFSFWINPDPLQPGNGVFIRNGIGGDENYSFKLGTALSGKYRLSSERYTGSWEARNSTNYLIPASEWSHITIILTEGSNWKYYLNGKYIETVSIGNTAANGGTLSIGGHGGANGQYLNGYLDEFKIYSTALTDQEILQDYNLGSAISFGTTNQTIGGTTTSLEYCIPGDTSFCASPVGEWKLDEGVGTNASDTSGNNNTGTLGTGNLTPNWTQGKIGSGLSFDGNNDVVDASNIKPINITASMWIYPTSFSNQSFISLLSERSSYSDGFMFFTSNGGYLRFDWGGSSYRWDTGYQPPLNQWTFLTISRDTNGRYLYVNGQLKIGTTNPGVDLTTSSNLHLGWDPIGGGFNFQGKIDQVKIYDYARTPAQIAYDYNKGAPVGWWKFDECQSNTVYDWSGNNNNGTINIGSGGSQNSLGTCSVGTSAAWTNGSTGKINSSLKFDGTDDYVNTSQVYRNDDLTWSAWVKTSSNGAIVGNNYGTASTFWHGGITIVGGKANMEIGYISSAYRNQAGTSTVTDNKWHQIVMTSSSLGSHLYIDGKQEASSVYYVGQVAGSYEQMTCIGVTCRNGASYINYFNGQLDDVRIYNYALTDTQVKTIYNGGAVNFN